MQISAEKVWNSAQEQLRSRLTPDVFNMWFAPLRVCGVDASHITLETPNEFSELWLKENYLSLLQDAVGTATGRQLQVKFKAAAGGGLTAPASATGKARAVEPLRERSLANGEQPFNPKNTFDTFVVGQQQQFRLRGAVAVAQVREVVQSPLSMAASVWARPTCSTPSASTWWLAKKARGWPMFRPKSSPTNT